jgi:hypothetical protein
MKRGEQYSPHPRSLAAAASASWPAAWTAEQARPHDPTPAAATAEEPHNETNPMDEAVRQALAATHGLDPATATEDDVNAAVIAATAATLPTTEPNLEEPVAETPVPHRAFAVPSCRSRSARVSCTPMVRPAPSPA